MKGKSHESKVTISYMDNVANFLNPSGLKFLLEKAGKFKKTKTLTASYGKLYGTQE